MYKEFYHLSENPFNITADPDFFFASSFHQEAFGNLQYGIQQRKGILVMTGEIGTGKTILCRTLLNQLDYTTKTALILNPTFSSVQLIQMILHDLGVESKSKNKFSLISALNAFLLQETSQGHNVVVVIDEAQNLGIKQLEQIRLLSNLETEKDKLLQIILVGQPELLEKLKLPQLRQLNQRILVRYHLKNLSREELTQYILHRLYVANVPDNILYRIHFTEEAIDAIYDYSQGTPRMVNILCDRALLAGYVAETRQIDDTLIERCAQEVMCQ